MVHVHRKLVPPFDGLPLKTIVRHLLIHPVDTHHMLVILVYHLREMFVAQGLKFIRTYHMFVVMYFMN